MDFAEATQLNLAPGVGRTEFCSHLLHNFETGSLSFSLSGSFPFSTKIKPKNVSFELSQFDHDLEIKSLRRKLDQWRETDNLRDAFKLYGEVVSEPINGCLLYTSDAADD